MLVLKEKSGDETLLNPEHLLAITPGPTGVYEVHFAFFPAAAAEANEAKFSFYIEDEMAKTLVGRLSSAHNQMRSGFRSFENEGLMYLVNLKAILGIQRNTLDTFAVYMANYTGSKQRHISLPIPVGQAIMDSFQKTTF